MDAISKDFHGFDIVKMATLANSKEAQQLFAMLGGQQNPQLRTAVEQAVAGDMTQAKNIIQSLSSDPKIRQLLQQMAGDYHG